MNVDLIDANHIDSKYLFEDDSLSFNYNKSKIVVIGNNPIGFYTTHSIFGRLTLEYNLFKYKRNQGLGGTFVNIVTELVGKECPEYDKIYLLISSKNKKSEKVAKKNNYDLSNDYEFWNLINEEMPEYSVYEKNNEFSKKNCKRRLLNK